MKKLKYKKTNVEEIEKIYNKYLKKYSFQEITAKLIYFYQFLDIHNQNLKSDNYEGSLKTIKENFENTKGKIDELIGHYWKFLILNLQTEQDELRKIEYKIALDKLLEYFLLFGKGNK